MNNIDNVSTRILINEAKRNMLQLLNIGIYNTDENIKQVYGGERGLLDLLRGYLCLIEDLSAFLDREASGTGGSL